MNIEKIAEKLRPIMPDQVRSWMQARELADPDLKALIEKQIISTAYTYLGDFHGKILLSLPPEKKSKGTINLGTILYDTEKWDVGVSKKELLQNMGIFGRSGSGKTNLAFHIIQQLDRYKIPYLFFDNKRTLRHLIPGLRNKVNVFTPGRSLSKFSFNPFITPPGLEAPVYINQLVDVLASAFTLGDGSRSILQKAIFACYNQGNHSPSVKDIIAEVDKIESKERVKGWKISALRALETLSFSHITANKASQEELTQKLTNGNTVIELDGLSDGARKFLIPIIYQWIFQVKLCSPAREKLTMVVFIDEAHLLFDNSSSGAFMERLLRQTRELGIATVVMDQTPSLISKVILANCYTNIFLNLVSASDLSKAAAVCLLDTDDKKHFSTLPVGQGIVKLQDKWTKPLLVKFPHVDIQKGLVTDETLLRYSSGIPIQETHSLGKTSIGAIFNVFRRILFDVTLKKQELEFIYDVLTYPQSGVRERYRRLGISDKKGHQIKNDLLYNGWIESQTIELGQTRKVLLRLTKQAKKTFGLDSQIPEFGSLVHEYWKNYYAEKFQKHGYEVQLEAPRKSGNVDILTIKDGNKTAIEIETGKSDIIRNVKQNLISGFDRILIIATDKKAYAKVECELAKEGLIGIEKIEIVLKDERIRI